MPVQNVLISPPRGRVRRAFVAVLLAAIASCAAAATADAGRYHVYVCHLPDGAPIASLPPEMSPSAPLPGASAFENCSSAGAVQLNWGVDPGTSFYTAGQQVYWSFNGTSRIASLDMRRTAITHSNGADWEATPTLFVRGFHGDLEACAARYDCQLGRWAAGWNAENDVHFNLPADSAGYVQFGIECRSQGRAGTCATDWGARAQMAIWQMDFVLEDAVAPVATSATGVAFDESVKRGKVSVSYSATDWESGIYQTVISIDGKEFSRITPDSNGGRCADARPGVGSDLEFLTGRPCKSTLDVTQSLDTTRISDGGHLLTVDVRDASGNVRTVGERSITIDNVPPPANKARPVLTGENLKGPRPSDVLGFRDGLWSGDDVKLVHRWQRSSADGSVWNDIPQATGDKYSVALQDVGRQLRVSETATNREGTVTLYSDPTEIVKSGAIVAGLPTDPAAAEAGNGLGGNPSTAQLVVDREQRTVEVKHGAKIVITGRLVDADSQPIADAQVDVFEQLAITAAPWKKIGSVKTDSQGGYLYRPRTTASRRLRFAYSDRRDAADYRATREVFVSVTAGMSIRAQRKVLNRRGVIRLKGRVVLDSLPASGVWVEVQVLDAGVWRTVATRRTSRTGLWTFRHRLRQSAGITFRFRGRLKVAGDVASADAKSAPVKVRVR